MIWKHVGSHPTPKEHDQKTFQEVVHSPLRRPFDDVVVGVEPPAVWLLALGATKSKQRTFYEANDPKRRWRNPWPGDNATPS